MVRDVNFAPGKLAERLTTVSVRLARMILIQAIRNELASQGLDESGDRLMSSGNSGD